jgi:hypothetical protein
MVVNNKKTLNKNNNIHTEDDIINYIFNNLLIDITFMDKMSKINNILEQNYSSNYDIQINTKTISIFEKDTLNGYYIYFDIDTYANIGYIRNNRYYTINSKQVLDCNSIVSILDELMNTNTHNIIKFYDVINPMFLDYDGDENQDCNLNTSFLTDPESDPVD